MDKELVLYNFENFIGENWRNHVASMAMLLLARNANEESQFALDALLALAED